jgi:hypothetical protein
MSWDTVVRALKTKYQSLKGQGLWTPQATAKKKDDKLSGLHTAISKLIAQVGSGTREGGGRGFSAMDATSWDIFQGISHSTTDPLALALHLLMVCPSLGVALVAGGQKETRNISLLGASIATKVGRPSTCTSTSTITCPCSSTYFHPCSWWDGSHHSI